MRGLLHDGEDCKPVAEVEVHVELRGGLLPPVPRPVEAGERQLHRGGVEGMHGSLLEAGKEAPALARREVRAQPLVAFEHSPEHQLGHLQETAAGGNILPPEPQSPSGIDLSCGHVNGMVVMRFLREARSCGHFGSASRFTP